MILKKSFKFRLRPKQEQEARFFQFAGACRWVYNRGLAQRKESWEKEHRTITLFDQNKELPQLKEQEETSWLKEVHSQVLQQALRDLNQAFLSFFRRIKQKETPGYPCFRCKGERDSFRYPQGVKVDGDRAYLPKIGWVRFRKSREIEGEINQATIVHEGDGWYISFSCEVAKEVPLSPVHNLIGIDVGLQHFATIASEGEIEEVVNP